MKNKKNIYFLIPAVLIIWGLIGYRVVKTINPKSNDVVQLNPTVDFEPAKTASIKTYTIHADYRDPFLGVIASNKKVKPKKIRKPKEQIIFPNIVFKGVVSPKSNHKAQVFLVQINGQQYLLKIKDIAQDILLKSGNQKEIVLEYKKTRQTFQIQN